VLSILLANPIPILIPCHRVVEDRFAAGDYVGGIDAKRWLLALERQDDERL
jgi:methylated-DNA-[protein]-cysteine S-methyltransferase